MKLALSADASELERPGTVTVRWTARDATRVVLTDVGTVPAEGHRELEVAETRTFVLTAFDSARGRVACKQVTIAVRERVARGVIVPWYGDAREPPEGWAICDGANGTPDLRGRFVRGADGARALPHTSEERGTHRHALAAGSVPHADGPDGAHTHVVEGVRVRRWIRGDRSGSVGVGRRARWPGGAHVHDLRLPPFESPVADDPLPAYCALHYLMKT